MKIQVTCKIAISETASQIKCNGDDMNEHWKDMSTALCILRTRVVWERNKAHEYILQFSLSKTVTIYARTLIEGEPRHKRGELNDDDKERRKPNIMSGGSKLVRRCSNPRKEIKCVNLRSDEEMERRRRVDLKRFCR